MPDNKLTPSTISSALSFDKRFDTYEENLEKKTNLKKELLVQENELKDFLRNYGNQGSNVNVYPSDRDYGYSKADTKMEFPPVYTIKVYKKVETNEEFEKYRELGTGINNELLQLLDLKFPGLKDYVKDIKNYFDSLSRPTEDKEATQDLQDKYTKMVSNYERLFAETSEVSDRLANLERYVDTADKVSRIGKRSKDEEK